MIYTELLHLFLYFTWNVSLARHLVSSCSVSLDLSALTKIDRYKYRVMAFYCLGPPPRFFLNVNISF